MGDAALLPASVSRRLAAPQLRHRAVQHPFGLDAAAPDDRRLSVRLEMVLRLFALFAALRAARFPRPRSWAACPRAATSSSFAIRAARRGFGEARHRPARRHDRGPGRRSSSSTARRCRGSGSPIMPLRSRPNSPCRGPWHGAVPATAGRGGARSAPIRASAKPCPTARSYDDPRPARRRRRRRRSGRSRVPDGPSLRDGRQSRRQLPTAASPTSIRRASACCRSTICSAGC